GSDRLAAAVHPPFSRPSARQPVAGRFRPAQARAYTIVRSACSGTSRRIRMTGVPPSPRYDPSGAEAFAARMSEMLNAGAAACMVAIGHRLGLFDLLAGMAPATSAAIAERAKLAERYV